MRTLPARARRPRLPLALLVLMTLAGLAPSARADGVVAGAASAEADVPQEFLDRARRLDVLFGHQSVGGNLLEGLALLAESDEKRWRVERVEDPAASWYAENDGWGDFAVGENEQPFVKIDHFVRKVRREGFGAKVAVASMKLCWIDFAGTPGEARRIFVKYRDAMEALQKEFARVRFVWWTAPLKTDENPTRHEFNELVRAHCREKGRPLFDVADLEGRDAKDPAPAAPVLLARWAEDDGHLNDAGRRRVARAWWWLMARLAGWSGSAS